MITYKQGLDGATGKIVCVQNLGTGVWIPFVPANIDYQIFKLQINANEVELQDAEGNLMTPEQVQEFIKELP